MANIHKLRKVPESRDGRSAEEIREKGFLTAVWYSGDGPEHGYYEAAREMYEKGLLDEQTAIGAVFAILTECTSDLTSNCVGLVLNS